MENISVYAYSWNDWWWEYAGNAYTDANGQYEIGGLSAGTYRLAFHDYYDGDYVTEYYDNAYDLDSATDILVDADSTVSNVNASLALGARIAGTVTGPDGTTPLDNIDVEAYRWNGSWWDYARSGWTDASGQYAVRGLRSGTYRLEFYDYNGDYLTEYYDNAPDQDSATDILVDAESTVSNINASLALAGKISGTVTGPDGTTPLSNIGVDAYTWNGSWWDYAGSGGTDGSGQYEVGGLTTGTYRLEFRDYYYGNYIDECYDDAPDLDSATDIPVAQGTTVSNVNASLALGGKIAGTVTGPDGTTPLEDISVVAYRWNGSHWLYVRDAWTDASGQYEVGGLTTAAYRLQFSDYYYGYVTEYYDNEFDLDSATDIPVALGSTVSNINASLSVPGMISGTVTGPDGTPPLEDIHVQAYTWNGSWWEFTEDGWTDASGQYEVGGLLAGAYRLRFTDYSDHYFGEYYDNAADMDSATDILVALDSTVSNVNASLALPGMIAGKVTGPDGTTPLPDQTVTVYSLDGTYDWRHQYYTGEDGHYEIGWLPDGDYTVLAGINGSDYLAEWYHDVLYMPGGVQPDPSATVVSVTGGSVVSNIDFSLDRAGRLHGTVTVGDLPLEGVAVEARGLTHGNTYSVVTDMTGGYKLSTLYPDQYVLKAIASDFMDEWWDGAHHREDATPFFMTNNSENTIDFDLTPGQSPVLVEITSHPTGAVVYLDYQATTNVTPVVLDMGEVADWVTVSLPYDTYLRREPGYAPRTITVRKEGRPIPSPREVQGVEAETVSVYFDLTSDDTGSLSIATVPESCDVYVDYADASVGVSPIEVGNLAPGSHVILLKNPAYLRPRPVVAFVQTNSTNEVSVPLVPADHPNRLSADVRSVPPGATVYVDYLPTTNVTDIVVDWMDAASHAGDIVQVASHTIALWSSASHTVMLSKEGYRPSLPRYVPDEPGSPALMVVSLMADAESAIDADEDGLADQWEDAYRLRELAPTENGPDDDADDDGATNEEELRAGTNPMDGNSVFRMPALDPPSEGDVFTIVFNSVPGRRYIVLCTPTLTEGWTHASGLIEATAYQTSWSTTLTDVAACRFFRVIVLYP